MMSNYLSPPYSRQLSLLGSYNKMSIHAETSMSFTPFKASPARRLILSPHSFVSPSHKKSLSRRHSPLGTRKNMKFNILSYLPPEISVKILSLLQPVDLCRVSGVCVKWNQLSQLDSLAKKRMKYVDACREKYRQTKENYRSNSITTPQSVCRSNPQTFTVAASPLTHIQPTSTHRYRTPSPTRLLEEVSELKLVDNVEIRRCLFPDQVEDHVTQTVGKKANKSRLKRL